MTNKHKEVAPVRGKPVFKVIERQLDQMAPPASASAPSPAPQTVVALLTSIFADPRSGRDRRHARGETNDPRRVNGERRRAVNAKPWWLEKNYVDAHYFSP